MKLTLFQGVAEEKVSSRIDPERSHDDSRDVAEGSYSCYFLISPTLVGRFFVFL